MRLPVFGVQQNQLSQELTTMDIQHLFTNIKASISTLEQAVGNASPINKPFSFSFKPKSQSLHQQMHARKSSDNSIEEDINDLVSSSKQYKCFKCYGVINCESNHSLPLCEQCDGTQHISDTHPLTALFDKILRAKLPSLIEKSQYTLSSSIIDTFVQCHHCRQKIQSQHALFCDTCQNEALCQNCYNSKRFIHISSHQFVRKVVKNQMLKLKQNLPNMKKISQQLESEEGCVGDQLTCSNCHQELEECYQSCMDCELQGKVYLICSSCLEHGNYSHDLRHNFAVQMVSKESKFPRYSNTHNIMNATSIDYDIESNSIRHNDSNLTKTSIVFIPQIEPDDDCEEHSIRLSPLRTTQNKMESSETESFVFDEHPTYNPESVEASPESVKNKEDKIESSSRSRLRNQSMIKISMMDESEQIPFDQIVMKQFEVTTSQTAIEEEEVPQLQFHQVQRQHQEFLFTDYECDICGVTPIKNRRYHCKECQNYDICPQCFVERLNEHQHLHFEQIDGLKQKEERRLKVVIQNQRISLGNNSIIGRKSMKV